MHPPSSPPHPASALPFDERWVLAGTADDLEVESAVAAAASNGTDASRDALLSLISRIDLTSLNADDTTAAIRTLCRRARDPLAGTAAEGAGVRVAAVCVYPFFLPLVRRELEGSNVRVAVVAGGFPAGHATLRQRVAEVSESAAEGVDEIDTVINRSLALNGDWKRLHAEICELREAAGTSTLKVILATGELRTLQNVARASRAALLAGADFIKTSTGKEVVNATLPAGLVMMRAIRDHERRSGRRAGFKAAGGIRTPEEGLAWMRLVESTLGADRSGADLFRIGASGLLDGIVAALDGPGAPPPTAPADSY